MQENINIFDYHFKKGQEVLIDAQFLVGIMQFCEKVRQSQPQIAALLTYPSNVRDIKDKDGNLVKVDIDWKEHTPLSFSNTAFDENGAVPIVTDLAMYANQIQFAAEEVYRQNIINGVAVKNEKA